ncbi:hypothetical protein H2248_005647 [Termitomyces sp. 'cryptogamus']|nr:hypothetical protein H2248_005647 [Termitomyces sp. 'cryptogamus']
MLAGYVATGIVPVSDSGTFNGVGRFNGGPEVPFFVQNVESGKRYRFRIINQSARNVFTMSVDGHDLTIIETDGTPTTPMVVNEIQMLAGQRYSVVLEANQPVANYWINAPFVGGNPAVNPNQNATLSRAILRYAGAPAADPVTPMTLGPDNPNALIEANLRPLVAEAAPPSDVNITLELMVTPGKAQWNVNNVSYLSPVVPTLVKVLDGANMAADFNATENTFILPANSVIQIHFLPNDDDEAHPFHLHGNNFFLIKSNTTDIINTVDPIRRDVYQHFYPRHTVSDNFRPRRPVSEIRASFSDSLPIGQEPGSSTAISSGTCKQDLRLSWPLAPVMALIVQISIPTRPGRIYALRTMLSRLISSNSSCRLGDESRLCDEDVTLYLS